MTLCKCHCSTTPHTWQGLVHNECTFVQCIWRFVSMKPTGWRNGKKHCYRCERFRVRFRGRSNGHSVANGSPPLRCFFVAVLPRHYTAEMDLATRCTLRHNTASTMKISHMYDLLILDKHCFALRYCRLC